MDIEEMVEVRTEEKLAYQISQRRFLAPADHAYRELGRQRRNRLDWGELDGAQAQIRL